MAFGADLTDEEYLNMSHLQWLAHFYRHPTGPGSQGGHDAIFSDYGPKCPYPEFTEKDKEIWLAHHRYVMTLPDCIFQYIAGPFSVELLSNVTDAGEFGRLIKDAPLPLPAK